MRGRDKPISLYTARHYMGCYVKTLRRAAEQGYVRGLTRTERGSYYASLEAWQEGYEAYRQAQRERRADAEPRPKINPPPGWITAAEAARHLGVSHETTLAIARARLVPLYIHQSKCTVRYYAHPHAWERALRWWRQGHGAEERRKMMPPPSVNAETARRRLESLTPYQRVALRAFIRAVMLGLPLPRQWVQRLQDEFETARAMYGEPESA